MALRWVADTYFNFGLGLKPSRNTATVLRFLPADRQNRKRANGSGRSRCRRERPERYRVFQKAGKTYQAILKRINAEPVWASSPNAKVATTLRMAAALRELGRYGDAIKTLIPVLETNETNLELQTEAASILQEWGKRKRSLYTRAIQGAVPKQNGRNLIWGWNRIITLLTRNINKSERFKERFYEAILNKTECRNKWLAGLDDPAARVAQARAGETELLKIHRLHPDLGGPTTKRQLEAYLKSFRETAGIASEEGFPRLQQEKVSAP